MRSNEATTSLWEASVERPEYPPLHADPSADVCVVGAGIAGISVAHRLIREGYRVAVLDRAGLAAGETGQTTAHLASAQDAGFARLADLHGEDGARAAWESHAAAIDRIERVAREESIDCDFRRLNGYLVPGPDTSRDELREEFEAAREATGGAAEWLDAAPAGGFDGPAIRFPRQGRFNPLKYVRGLAEVITREGGWIHGGTHVRGIHSEDPFRVETQAGTVRAEHVVVATNSPIHLRFAMHTKQAPYRTYAIALELPEGVVEDVLLWDTAEPYHYVRHAEGGGGRYLVVGGEDHKTGQADEPAGAYDRLEAWARERFPGVGAVAHRWSGQVLEPVDGLGFIGREPGAHPGPFLVTGDSGQGMTHGTLAAIIIGDLIVGRENPWTELYDPERMTAKAAGTFAKENVNVAGQYADWIRPGEHLDEIAPGSGAVVRQHGRPVAVYRDETGTLHRRSAVCPHLGCVVRWNPDAGSWDCPCHGSRFSPDGEVLNGPAPHGLEEG